MNLHSMKSNLSDIASTTRDTTRSVGKDVSRSASKLIHSAPVSNFADKMSTLGKVIATASSVKALSSAMNPSIPVQWALGAMNLQRRPSTMSRIMTGVGLIAAGAAVGAGVALLLTPNNGEQNRDALRRALQNLKRDASGVVEQVESKAHDAVEQVESKARDVAQQVESSGRIVAPDGRDARADEISKGGGGAGTSGTRSRTPGISHRSPKI